MYKIVRKIAFATISLILAIVTFTGVTFAWLSINSDAWIEGMQIEATSGKGFLVSVDGYNYSSSLIEDQIVKAILIKYRKGYTINQNGELLDENNEKILSKDYEKLFKNIRLEPCTSYETENYDLQYLFRTPF